MHAEQFSWLLAICILLAGGIVAVIGARLARVTPIVGYLLVGAGIGPYGFAWVEDGGALHFLAEFGVAFLMFDIGLHFSLKSLWDTRHQLFGLGPLQFLLTALPLMVLFALFDVPVAGTVFLAAALALSSTAVVLQAFAERNERDTPLGHTVTAVLIFQDLVAVLLLVAIGAVTTSQSAPLTDLLLAFVKIAAAFAFVAVLGRAVHPIFDRIVQHEDEATFVAAALLLVMTTAGVTAAIGLSLALGAFLAGMALSESEYCYRVKTEIRPFRGLLLGLFFLTVGMALNTATLIEIPLTVLALFAAFLLIKLVAGVAAARLLRQQSGFAVRFGFSLAQGSEFAFVIMALALGANLISTPLASAAVVVVVASMVLTGLLIPQGDRLGRLIEARVEMDEPAVQLAETAARGSRVIINGLDDTGRSVAEALHGLGIDYLALETDPDRLHMGRSAGFRVAHGDPLDFALLQSLDLGSASAMVLGVARGPAAVRLISQVRERYPDLPILLRALDAQTAGDAAAAGAKVCVRLNAPNADELVLNTLRQLGVSEEKVQRWENATQPSLFERADKAHQLLG